MKILMLVNWKVKYTDHIPSDKQPPDYYVEGIPYWFFRYFKHKEKYQVDVVDTHSFFWLEKFEKNKLHFYIWQTIKVLHKLNAYDLVLSHGMQSGIVLCLWRRIFGKGKYKHIVFDIGAFNSARETGKNLKLMQYASKSLDGVIYHTSHQKEYYKKCHPWLLTKSRFIPFGTDYEYFIRQKELVRDFGQHDDYILCAGYNKRDWETLLKAYNNIQTGVKLKLIGKGDIKCEDPRVEVMPAVSTLEFIQQVKNALFCVLPLQQFNYSYGQMTLLQQMVLGKAVIVADVYSIEAYKRGNNMLTYPPEDEKVLQEKLESLLSDSLLRVRLGKAAEQSVKEYFNEHKMAEAIQEAIGEWTE
jgi:hypothetical protein